MQPEGCSEGWWPSLTVVAAAVPTLHCDTQLPKKATNLVGHNEGWVLQMQRLSKKGTNLLNTLLQYQALPQVSTSTQRFTRFCQVHELLCCLICS